MYRVVRFFRDLQDNNHAYHVGEQFPHNGMKVSEDRLKELSTDANRRHVPLIEKVEEEPETVEANNAQAEEPVEGFMNPPEEPVEDISEKETPTQEPVEAPKPKKKRGRPRNDA